MIFFVKLWGFDDCHFGQFGTINARYIFWLLPHKQRFDPRINRSKFVEGRLFALIDLLLGAKSIFFYFIWRMVVRIFTNFLKFEKKIVLFSDISFVHFNTALGSRNIQGFALIRAVLFFFKDPKIFTKNSVLVACF